MIGDALQQVIDAGCDYPNPPVYQNYDGTFTCRCMVCGRCGKHTGNTTQGHFWGYCQVTLTVRKHHFCCTDDCELEKAK